MASLQGVYSGRTDYFSAKANAIHFGQCSNVMDEIYNFRDKYLTEYQVKNTNILILEEAKKHRIVFQIHNIFTKPSKQT